MQAGKILLAVLKAGDKEASPDGEGGFGYCETKGGMSGLLCRVTVVSWVLNRRQESARLFVQFITVQGCRQKSQLGDQGNWSKKS